MKLSYYILVIITCCYANMYAQNNTNESKLKSNIQLGYYGADWYKFSKEGKFIEVGVGYKINEDFWLNLNINYSEGKGPNEPYLNLGDNPNKSKQFTIVPTISKYFNLTKRLDISGKVGTYVSFQDYYNYEFSGVIKHTHNTNIVVGAIVGADLDYKITKNLSVGIMSSFVFELSYGYSGLYVGPKVEWMFL